MRKFCGACVVSALLLAGCVTTPPLQEDGIAIGAIVERVKCEIAFAAPTPQPPWPTGRYQWMSNWTAKVDLTLITNARSTITPTSVFTNFLHPGAIPDISNNIARNITLGVGAGVDTTAERTEVLTFSLSLAEMLQYKKRAECNLPNGRDLYGNLGLHEWVQSALAPVESGKLSVGRHPRLGGKAPPAPAVTPTLELRKLALDPLAELKQAKTTVAYYAKYAEDKLARARDDGSEGKIQATYDDAGYIYGAEIKARPERQKVKTLAQDLLKSEPNLKNEIQNLQVEAAELGGKIDTAKNEVDAIIKDLPHDPPIDSLSHSVRFVVAVSGNLSPNWTLVNFRGPASSGSLLSGTRTTTHTLNIVMGSPDEQNRQLTNLVILQNLRPSQ